MSNESKHTPAPWKVSKHVDTNETVIRSNDGDIIANLECDKVQDFMKDPKAEVEANARLIAAAPEMYNKLKEISDALMSNRQRIPSPLLKALMGVHEIIDQIKPTQI